MTYYRRVGDVPAKRHRVHRADDGSRLNEELVGAHGFRGPSALLYHRHSPSALVDIRAVDEEFDRTVTANEPLTPLHLRTPALDDDSTADLIRHRHVLAGNAEVTLAVAHAGATSPLYRNAAGDELVFVAGGRARFESVFGTLDVGAGDYVIVPAGSVHRWVIHEPVRALVVEARGHVRIPDRYRTDTGQLVEGAPFCERDLRGPDEPMLVDGTDVEVFVRSRTGLSVHTHAHHPFDVVAWDGSLYPYAFAIGDFEPIVGAVHQPPPVHQTFAGPGFVVCSFVPRPFDFGPDAVKIPYHHSNVDSDEILYYVDGNFMSRAGSGIDVGSLSLHPAGFTHGPQPGSFEASVDVDRTEETAVMIDTFAPLGISETARRIADPNYWRSWHR